MHHSSRPRAPAWVLLPILGLTACGSKEDSAAQDIPPPVPSDEVACGDSAPTIEALTIADNGFFQCEQKDWPSLLITAETTDPDGDLTFYEYRLWWDTEVDDHVDTSGSYLDVVKTLSDGDCDVPSANLAMILCITGNPPYSADVEFGVVIYDAEGNPSHGGEATVASFTTPDADGNY